MYNALLVTFKVLNSLLLWKLPLGREEMEAWLRQKHELPEWYMKQDFFRSNKDTHRESLEIKNCIPQIPAVPSCSESFRYSGSERVFPWDFHFAIESCGINHPQMVGIYCIWVCTSLPGPESSGALAQSCWRGERLAHEWTCLPRLVQRQARMAARNF